MDDYWWLPSTLPKEKPRENPHDKPPTFTEDWWDAKAENAIQIVSQGLQREILKKGFTKVRNPYDAIIEAFLMTKTTKQRELEGRIFENNPMNPYAIQSRLQSLQNMMIKTQRHADLRIDAVTMKALDYWFAQMSIAEGTFFRSRGLDKT